MDSIESKQALLRKQILEDGIDPEQFVEFLGRIKGEGDTVDLENWSLSELEQAIKEFKQQNAQAKKELNMSRLGRDVKKSKIFQVIKVEKVVYENTNLWDYELYEEQECSKAEAQFKMPKQDDPKITIQKSEIKSVGGFIFGIGARNELNLTISTNFTDNKVVRKGEDADWLRSVLAVNYPGYYLPPLQAERELNTDDHKGIEKRKNQIQVFLNKLMSFNMFHSSRHVQAFFQEYNHKKFTEFRNRQGFLEIVRDVDTVETPTGKFQVQISNNMNKLLAQSSRLGEQMNALYNEMNNCCLKIVTHMQKTDKYVKDLSIITGKLNEKYAECQRLFKLDDLKLPTIFLSFNNIANNTSKNLRRHTKAFYDFYDTYVKEVSRDWTEFLNNDTKVQKQLKKYLSEKEALVRKKEKYINDISRWELPEADYLQVKTKDVSKWTKQEKFAKMFPSDNDNENRIRLWLAYVNQNYKQSFKAFLFVQQKFLINKFTSYSGEATCLNKEMLNNFAEVTQMLFG